MESESVADATETDATKFHFGSVAADDVELPAVELTSDDEELACSLALCDESAKSGYCSDDVVDMRPESDASSDVDSSDVDSSENDDDTTVSGLRSSNHMVVDLFNENDDGNNCGDSNPTGDDNQGDNNGTEGERWETLDQRVTRHRQVRGRNQLILFDNFSLPD